MESPKSSVLPIFTLSLSGGVSPLVSGDRVKKPFNLRNKALLLHHLPPISCLSFSYFTFTFISITFTLLSFHPLPYYIHINTLTPDFFPSSLVVYLFQFTFSSTVSLSILNFIPFSPKKGLLCHDTKLPLRMQINHDLSVVLSSLPPNLYLFIDTGPICFPFGTSVPGLSPRSSIDDSVYQASTFVDFSTFNFLDLYVDLCLKLNVLQSIKYLFANFVVFFLHKSIATKLLFPSSAYCLAVTHIEKEINLKQFKTIS